MWQSIQNRETLYRETMQCEIHGREAMPDQGNNTNCRINNIGTISSTRERIGGRETATSKELIHDRERLHGKIAEHGCVNDTRMRHNI